MVKYAAYAVGDSATRHMVKNFLMLGEEPVTSCGLTVDQTIGYANDGRNISSEDALDCESCRDAWRRVRFLR